MTNRRHVWGLAVVLGLTAACSDGDDTVGSSNSATSGGTSGASAESGGNLSQASGGTELPGSSGDDSWARAGSAGNPSQASGGTQLPGNGSGGGGARAGSAGSLGEASGGTGLPGNAGSGSERGGGAGAEGVGGLPPANPADIGYVAGPAIIKTQLITGSTSEVDYAAQVPGYPLPLDIGDIVNLQADVSGNYLVDWNPDAEAKLAAHGIVALPATTKLTRFETAYQLLKSADAPILVTTDSTLHLYHLLFDQVLKSLEMNELLPVYQALLPAVVDKLRSLRAALDADNAEAARRSMAALSVAAKLMFPDTFTVPPEVATEVDQVITLVNGAREFELDPIFNHGCDHDTACSGGDVSRESYEAGKACFCEDYSQYKPRGHYTEHPALEQYFRGAMYLGRIGLRIKSPMETRMAAILTSAMTSTSVTFRESELPAMELWDRLRRVTSFFVGTPDDLTFIEYDRVLREVYGQRFELTVLDDQAQLDALRARLSEERAPKIMSGMVQWYLDETEQTQGLRFLGQSFAFDSYALGQLVFSHVGPNVDHQDFQYVVDYPNDVVYPYCGDGGSFTTCEGRTEADWAWLCCKALAVGRLEGRSELADICRLLPKGLDVAAAYGSSRAEEHLEPDKSFCGYANQLASLQAETAAQTDEDHWSTLYAGWLHSVHPLFERDYTGLPTWMGAETYRDKALQTGLASWAELRHDTILYVKQSYTSGLGGRGNAGPTPDPPVNRYYVEPQPEVYSRLSDLTRLTRDGLKGLDMLSDELDAPVLALQTLLDNLTRISIAELQHLVVDTADQDYIATVGTTFERIIVSIGIATAEPPEEPTVSQPVLVQAVTGDPYKTTIVADVHTDGNTERVLEAGSGYVDWVVVVNLDPTGALVASIGPIFSYYEFAQAMSNRLDDDQWNAILEGSAPPARPGFVAELYVE
ncbi:MAG: DUF3160 domain-containing protein [Polyangiaceae bacterium]|nr:DUF3160 domain-containing protein [Polyangiaceae bacterium]